MALYSWDLRWLDIAPSTHVFDISLVEAEIENIVRRHHRSARDRILEEVNQLFVRTFGDWALSWSWCVPNGGPVRHFCCSSHSVLPDRESDPEPTIRRIHDSLVDLRAYLEELDAAFAEIHARQLSPIAAIEHAAPRLYDLVTARTSFEDAWYGTFERALAWFAETVVYDAQQAQILVDEVIGGTFTSWTEPTPEARTTAFSEVKRRLEVLEAGAQLDGLAAWLAIRPKAFAAVSPAPPRRRVTSDGHERYIERADRARDPERAARMMSALALCRDAARHDLPLAAGLLSEWQAVVLGASQPVELRTTDAFAKRGRERYPHAPTLPERFERAIAEANERETPIAIRAARVYLDVCFFHPFADGNARAARLALDHVLAREGLALHEARGIFDLSRASGDERGAWSLAVAIDRLAGPRG